MISILFFGLSAFAETFDGIMVNGVDILGTRQAAPIEEWIVPEFNIADNARVLQDYNHLDPQHFIDTRALEQAVLFFDANKPRIKNQKFMTVLDFHEHSGRRRFFIINMATGAVEPLYVSHGSGSDKNNDGYAEVFGNLVDSHMSSLGFYLTGETYEGRNGYSLKLDGLSTTNSNARDRFVVVHKASYVSANLSKMGMSQGCPALEVGVYRRVIDATKGGSLLYGWIP